ncbi:biotin synthase BioB [Eubacterium ruminantium]|uniref:biotin synthase BioB n=1 Tax=Eubacterium ruminantium TaxID=42322 RepID=UPI00247B06B6|nr:biotin synthase BioB [Eubacterium ruminantium]
MSEQKNLIELAKEIIGGRRLNKDNDLSFFITCNLEELGKGADMIREHFSGAKVDLCTIINGKSGKCSENCKFCAQSAHNDTNCEVYDLLDEDRIVEEARSNQEEGVDRFAIVTAGRSPKPEDFERIIKCYKRMSKELTLDLCTSLGFLTLEQFKELRAAGVTSYHNNIETSRRFFPQICTSHSFDDKIENIKRAKAAGLYVCSGGIIGMGETWEDRIDMALTLSELGISSIPINSLTPIPGTPLHNNRILTEEEILRTIAIFKYINPTSNIRLAAGRVLMKGNGENAFHFGAAATITGNMLTTSGSTIKYDRKMLKEMGREVI